MKGGRALLVSAAVSVGLHAAVAGGFWAFSPELPAAPPAVVLAVARAEPVRVSLWEAAPPGPAAADARAAAPVRARARARPGAAPTLDRAPPMGEAPASALPDAPDAPDAPGAGEAASPAGAAGGAGTGSAIQGGGGPHASGPDLRRLSEALRRSAARCYPAPARRFRLTGSARVSFCVEEGGGLARLELRRTSGHPLLDEAALGCVVPGAVPLPAAPGCFELDIDFKPGR